MQRDFEAALPIVRFNRLELWAADQAVGRLDGSTDARPNPDLFVFIYVRKEAVLSSQIEGTQASLMDVLEFEAQALDPGCPKNVDEVSSLRHRTGSPPVGVLFSLREDATVRLGLTHAERLAHGWPSSRHASRRFWDRDIRS